MYISIPYPTDKIKRRELVDKVNENDLDVVLEEKYQKPGMLTYWVEFAILAALNRASTHMELIVEKGKSIELEGLCSSKELSKIRRYEQQNTLHIIDIEDEATWQERVNGENLSDFKHSTNKYIKLILHVDEREAFLKENLYEYMDN
ncbi:hypothetical protein CN918_26150 [Priestia megaterium]|nr:hypothetical protein CN918_26150 [Priestia megaterium]